MQATPVTMLSRLRHSAFVFPIAVLAAFTLLVISETAYRQSTRALTDLRATTQTRSTLQTLLRRVADAESGQRGYLLTGRPDYLEPYRAAAGDIDKALADLKPNGATDEIHRATLAQLEEVARRKLSELALTLAKYDEGKRDAWQTLLLSDMGKEDMQTLRRLADELIVREDARLVADQRAVIDTLRMSRIGVAAMTAISLIALWMYLRQTSLLAAHRRDQSLSIQAERDALETAVAHRTAELTELAQHLQTAREDERSRLARELHDELGALLTAAKLDAARIKSRLGDLAPEANERLVHLNETLNQGIALKRRIIEDLRPSSLSNLGLISALEIQAREFADRSGMTVDCRLDIVDLSPAVELTIYRVVQEAFTNIAKYAKATHVDVILADRGTTAELTVGDDGIGFSPEANPGTSAHGLLGMRYRVNAEGGQLRLDSRPGAGTRIIATVPILELPTENP